MDSHSTSEDSADELLERVKVIVRCGTDSTGLAAFACDMLVDGSVALGTAAAESSQKHNSPPSATTTT